MTTTVVDEGLLAAARSAMTSLRRAEHAVRESVAALKEAGVAGPAGYRSTRRLVEDLLRVDPGEAARLLAHGAALRPGVGLSGQPVRPALPASARAAGAGAIGSGHLRVITRTVEHLAEVPGLEPSALADAEALLAAQAGQLAPAGLARVAARLVATLDPDGAAPEDPPEPEDEVLVGRRRDGALALSALVRGGADAEMVLEVLDALSTPAGPDDPRPLARRRAEALLDLFAQALSPTGVAHPDDPAPDDNATHPHADGPGGDDTPDDDPSNDGPRNDDGGDGDGDGDERGPVCAAPGHGHAGDSGRSGIADTAPGPRRGRGCPPVRVLGRALLTVTIDHEWLRSVAGHGLLDSELAISPAEARRLACDAGVVPMVLGARGEPVDVGRLSYTVPDGLRRALHHRDRGCAFPGCTRRPRRCHAHHVRHWADGGTTSLENLTLLCRYHHHLVHHDHWQVTMIDGRPWFVPPRWIDPDRRPRPGGASAACP